MGAGDYLAGDSPAGDDPEIVRSAPRRVTPPAAILFDGASKDFPLDERGLYQESHPVDQRVVLAILTIRGTLAGNPDVGSALRSIGYIDQQRLRAQVEDAVNVAIAAELSAKNIKLLGIDIEVPNRNAFTVRVRYRNLRLSPSADDQSFTVRVPVNG